MTPFRVGDHVRPRPEWKDDPNNIPSGVVRRIEPWGDVGALYVGDERRAFAAYVLEHTDDGTERSEMIAEAQEAGQAPTVQWLLLAEANA